MPVGFQIAIAFVIGGALGLLIGWLMGARKPTGGPADARLENEFRQQLAQREAELKQAGEQLLQAKTSLATAQANLTKAIADVADAKKAWL